MPQIATIAYLNELVNAIEKEANEREKPTHIQTVQTVTSLSRVTEQYETN